LPGVVRTRVGYAGGTSSNPTYRNIGDHSEAIQIDYDPTRISYAELLDVFWASHTPTSRPYSRQYMSIIFFHDDEQKRLAEASRERVAAGADGEIFTEIVPYDRFTLAEGYHQKYLLRQIPELADEFTALYPDLADFVDSTAVTRVNGYVGGHGSLADLEAEIDALGLSLEGQEKLREIVSRG
jgi:methionine-S-sulfoxide reductase